VVKISPHSHTTTAENFATPRSPVPNLKHKSGKLITSGDHFAMPFRHARGGKLGKRG
jgi:hypothetical protein